MSMTLREQLVPFAKPSQKVCLKKIRYWSERQASRIAELAMATRPDRIWVYRCPHCEGWHLTRMEQ